MELNELNQPDNRGLSTDRTAEGKASASSMALTRNTGEQQRVATAMRMGSLAAAAQHAAGDLEEQFPEIAHYMRDAATRCERIANLLRDPNLDEVAGLISSLGRKHPGAIVAGASAGTAARRSSPAASAL